MGKTKTVWYCNECGHKQSKWLGQCPQCMAWNTLQEEVELSTPRRFEAQSEQATRPVRLKDIAHEDTPRILTEIGELDRLLGGGLVRGSLTLVGGDPGIGKSTLLLQTSAALARQGLVVLYICGEESTSQTALRARRLGIESDNLLLLCETNFSIIKQQIDLLQPDILIVDSIQIVYKPEISSAPGSVSQVRETATEFMHLAKGRGISIFLIGHVTKTGEMAGPRVLEHLVDTVLYFEGDKHHHYRLMRSVKNRFGATDEVAVFQMKESGLTEVSNPSQLFLEERKENLAGSVIIPTLEGTRPLLVEVQALVTNTVYSTPSRRSTGLDSNRLALLLAVMEKRLGYQLFQKDVFVSIAGGLTIHEPAADLGVILAISSSLANQLVHPETLVVGEVGLGGEIRSVSRIEARINEGLHLGFRHFIVPKRNLKGLSDKRFQGINVYGVELVEEAIHGLIDRCVPK